jgi:hypothetical protein
MVDQPLSPPPPRAKKSGKLSLPETSAGMNKLGPNNRAIEGKGDTVGPDIPAEKDDDKGSDEADSEILERLRKRLERSIAAEAENRKPAVEDRKFKRGDQWPADIAAQRATDRRPCLTNNRMKTFVHQVTNPARENRPQINISPLGPGAIKEGAQMIEGMIRRIERDSHADIAYDSSFDDAVTSGWGYMRLLTEWKSPKSFDQVLVIKRVRNPFTVYLDPDHQEPDGSDCRFAFVAEMIPEDQFKLEYPKAQLIPFEVGGGGESYRTWSTKDGIRVVEYYEIVEKERELVSLSNGYVGWRDELDEVTARRVKNGDVRVLDERKGFDPTVMYYKATAIEILERKEWIGKWVPIVKVIGDEIDVEGKVTYSGIIRDSKDAQRMDNYWAPLDLNTPVPTPNGWTTMGEIEAGHTVFNENGEPATVLGCSPVHVHRECYRITFDDGSSIVADAEHLWAVETRTGRISAGFEWRNETVQTKALRPKTHYVMTPKPLQLPECDLPLDPYFLGLWLGDGNAIVPEVSPGDDDIDELRRHLLGRGVDAGEPRGNGDRILKFTVYGVKGVMREMGLLGNKHIPASYLRASRDQRLDLLHGLMDTDGSIDIKRQCSFSTITPLLAEGFSELLRSLGIKAVSLKRKGRLARFANNGNPYFSQGQDLWQFSFTAPYDMPVFKRERQLGRQFNGCQEQWRRTKRFTIKSVERVPSVPVKCIMVDTPSHLFLAGEAMVPTHNTFLTEHVALAPKAHYIMEEGQLEGHEKEWKNVNRLPTAALTYKPTDVSGHPSPPPQRVPPPDAPTGILAALAQSQQNMMATTGIRFDATMQERMFDESGKALRELSRRTDIGAFHYYDNFRRSLEFLGKQIVDAIPKVYNRRQIITILGMDGKEENVTLDPLLGSSYQENQSAKGVLRYFNPGFAEWAVTVDAGPSYATKRQEGAESMMAFVKAMPNTAALVMDLIAAEMDWPGSDKIAARLAKAIPANMLTPDLKDIPPQIQALIQNLEQQSKQLQQQLQQAMKALDDKGADREIAMSKISADFEVKLLGIIAKTEETGKKLAVEQARFVADTFIAEIRDARQRNHEIGMAAIEASKPQESKDTPPNADGSNDQ